MIDAPSEHALFTGIRDRFADTPLLIADSTVLTGTDLDAMTAGRAMRLRQRGAGAGRWIALRVPPAIETVVDLLALWRCGAGAVLLDPRHPPEWETGLIRTTGVAGMWVEGAVGDQAAWSDLPAILSGAGVAVFSSGTESRPRAVVHDLDTLCFAARAGAARLGIGEGSVIPLTLPLHHVSGLMTLIRALVSGAAVRLVASDQGWRGQVQASRFTHVSLVAAQLKQILENPEMTASLRQVRCVLLGGGPTSDALLDRAWQMGIPVMNSYGMTETAAMIAVTPPGQNPAGLGAVPLYPGCVALDVTDRIMVRGIMLFRGWLEGGQLIPPPLTHEGWYRTGDTGELDARGRLYVRGRADAVIISGGEKIHPERLTAVLTDLPGVRAACVVGVPDSTYGEVPAAILAMAAGYPLPSQETVWKTIENVFPVWMRPRWVWPWPEEICAPSLKPPLHALRDWARTRAAVETSC